MRRSARVFTRHGLFATSLVGAALAVLGAAPALAAQNVTGLAHPPAWAVGKRVHFFPSPSAIPNGLQKLQAGQRARHPRGYACTSGCGQGTPPLIYRGGSIEQSPQVYLIFWGSNWNGEGAAAKAQTETFFSGLSGSTYQSILSQYSGPPQSYISATATVAGNWTDTSVPAPSNVSNGTVGREIEKAISSQGWQSAQESVNTQFVLLIAPESTYASEFGAGNFCGFHSAYGTATYSVDLYPSGVVSGCINHDPERNPANALVETASHEYAESATDPRPLAGWVSSDGEYEIGDMCAWVPRITLPDGAHATELWDNRQNACASADTTVYPPDVSTTSASGLQEIQATLNGTVTSRGQSTTYHFQYGTTTDYGSSTASNPAGSGYGPVSENATATGLEAGMTYHYRIVASSAGGTSYGSDQTFATVSKPAVYMNGTATQDAYFRGTNGAIWQWQWEKSNGKWHSTELGGQALGNPTAFVETASGNQDVYFRGSNGAIWQLQWEPSNGKWHLTELGGQTGGEIWRSAAGSPVAYANGTTQSVYFRGTNGAIWQWQWEKSNGKWHLTELGGQAAGDPTAFVETASGNQDVYFRGSNGAIWQLQWESSNHKWYLTELGGQTGGEPWRRAGGSPAAYLDEGSQMVYFPGTSGAIWQWQWEPANHKWSLTEL
ncbi:MAG TPA: hypothetical protein VK707_05295 [Solirubrobacteraceae bacterium]|nr:hypothetical protein [Solirubrobacteraceae bacterium]